MSAAPPTEPLRRIRRAFLDALTVCDGPATDYARPRVSGGAGTAGAAPGHGGSLLREMEADLRRFAKGADPEQLATQMEHKVARYKRGAAVVGPGPDASDADRACWRIRKRGRAEVAEGDHLRLREARSAAGLAQRPLAARAAGAVGMTPGSLKTLIAGFETAAESEMRAEVFLELLRVTENA